LEKAQPREVYYDGRPQIPNGSKNSAFGYTHGLHQTFLSLGSIVALTSRRASGQYPILMGAHRQNNY
jgi:hypothetical protein